MLTWLVLTLHLSSHLLSFCCFYSLITGLFLYVVGDGGGQREMNREQRPGSAQLQTIPSCCMLNLAGLCLWFLKESL